WLDGRFITRISRSHASDPYHVVNPVPRNETVDLVAKEDAMTAITVASTEPEQVIDLTDQVAALATSIPDGVCQLLTRHTTCALTILTDEEGIAEDFLSVLHGLVPQTTRYVHDSADHVRAHVLSALVGPSVSVPVRKGRLGLGQYQRI